MNIRVHQYPVTKKKESTCISIRCATDRPKVSLSRSTNGTVEEKQQQTLFDYSAYSILSYNLNENDFSVDCVAGSAAPALLQSFS